MKPKQEITLTPEQITIIANSLSGQVGGKSEAMESFLQKQNRLLDKQINEQEEAERIHKEQQRQGAHEMQKKRDREIAKQNSCPHIKPNRATAVGGQRDHSGNYHYICQLCSKEWGKDLELPNWLVPDPIVIGGPIH